MNTWEKQAIELIYRHAKQFRMYEVSHRAKRTPDADFKAEINRVLAEEAEKFIEEFTKGQCSG